MSDAAGSGRAPSPAPRRPVRRGPLLRRLAVAAVAIGVGSAGVMVAADDAPPLSGGATATEVAERRLPEVVDVVTIHDSGELDDTTRSRALQAATLAGANASVVQTVSSAMTQIRRGGAIVQAAPFDFSFPMSTTFLTDDTIATLMGAEVLSGLTDRTLVMSSGTASLRGARAGDVVTLRHVAGGTRDFTISRIVDDTITGGTELVMLPSAATRLGISRESRVLIWGFRDRDTVMQALAAAGVVQSANVGPGNVYDPPGSAVPIRLRRSWDPRDPDSTLGMGATKQLLGEFSYRINSNGSVTVDAGWTGASLPVSQFGFVQKRTYPLGIRAACHNGIHGDLTAALAEVQARGLGWTIDVANANSFGGCFVARFNRLAANSSVGFLSRHTWAMAIDTNTVANCQGCTPGFSFTSGGCETVRIFRKHGFAWGGNYTTPDGMHFEWVGEDRSRIPYPSRWCSNSVAGAPLVQIDDLDLELDQTERAVLFDDAGFVDHHHDHGGMDGDHGHDH